MRTKLQPVAPVGSAGVVSLLWVLFVSAFSVVVPQLSAQSIPLDTGSAQGFNDGEKAAEQRPVGMRFAGGFAGGFVAGFTAPFAIFGRSPEGFLIGGAGTAAIVAAAESGNRLPSDSLMSLAKMRGQWYRGGFEEGYSTRLRSRRRSAAFVGGAIGVGAGVGTLYYLISHFLPYT
jgi:hypothetical protein